MPPPPRGGGAGGSGGPPPPPGPLVQPPPSGARRSGTSTRSTAPTRLPRLPASRRRGPGRRRPGTLPGCCPARTAMNTGTLRALRPCQRSRRRRTCSDDHGVGIDDDQSTAMTTTTRTCHQKYCRKHIYRLLSTYCRTKDLYASRK